MFEQFDVLITPTSPAPAPLRADMSPEKMLGARSFTGVWNLTGLPALALPVGLTTTAPTLPLSMQLVGKPFDEATVLRAGDAYQRLTTHHLNVPAIAQSVAV